MTVRENLNYGARSAAEANLLSDFRIAHIADKRPADLSGGEARRVTLARAIACPEVVDSCFSTNPSPASTSTCAMISSQTFSPGSSSTALQSSPSPTTSPKPSSSTPKSSSSPKAASSRRAPPPPFSPKSAGAPPRPAHPTLFLRSVNPSITGSCSSVIPNRACTSRTTASRSATISAAVAPPRFTIASTCLLDNPARPIANPFAESRPLHQPRCGHLHHPIHTPRKLQHLTHSTSRRLSQPLHNLHPHHRVLEERPRALRVFPTLPRQHPFARPNLPHRVIHLPQLRNAPAADLAAKCRCKSAYFSVAAPPTRSR
jgi:hypothetical protein